MSWKEKLASAKNNYGIIGAEKAKEAIRDLFYSQKYKEEMKEKHVKPKIGLILYGVPGTGKSSLAKNMSNEYVDYKKREGIKVEIIRLKGKNFMRGRVGGASKVINELFEDMRINIKIGYQFILIIDEIDRLIPKRGKSGILASERTSAMLEEIGSIEDDLGNIFIIGTTNRPGQVDPAMMRSGRLKKVLVPIPTKKERKLLIEYYLKEIGILDIMDKEEIAELSNGLSGSDFEELKTDLFYLVKKKEEKGEKINIEDILDKLEERQGGLTKELQEIAQFEAEYKSMERGESEILSLKLFKKK